MADRPPCVMACPLGQDVPGYISAIATNNVDEAAIIVRRTNALPSVCGRVCIASCMRACIRARIDMGVDIRSLKRFAVHVAADAEVETKDGVNVVAIVGSGPAGLAAAHRLNQLGVRSVVFDAGSTPGGSMTVYQLPSTQRICAPALQGSGMQDCAKLLVVEGIAAVETEPPTSNG